MTLYDIIIVGAGPAGGCAAVHAAKKGLKVAVLEEHAVVGEPVHCGECLSNLGLTRLPFELPVGPVSEKVDGVRIIFPDGSSKLLQEPGVVLEKHLFEQAIIAEAKKNGADILLNNRVNAAVRENNVWTITTTQGSYQSKALIDASGAAAVLSRLLNLNPRFKTVTGIQYEMEGIPRDGFLDFYLWPELAPYGYLWMIPKCNGRANVGLVTDQIPKAKIFLDEFVKRKGWSDKVIKKTFGGPIPESGPVEHTVSDGVILIGDAAGFTSPLFEGGTHLGLRSGEFAIQVLEKAVKENNFSKEKLEEYNLLWKKEFPPYAQIIEGKKALYELTDQEFNELASYLPADLAHWPFWSKAYRYVKLLIEKPHFRKKKTMQMLLSFRYSRAKYFGW